MTRELFLVVYPEKIRVPAHWSMFIPHTGRELERQVIHAVGSPFTGYELETKDYDLSKTKKYYEMISLGSIDEGWLPHLISKAEGVKTPGVSKKPLDPFAGENCQRTLHTAATDALCNGNALPGLQYLSDFNLLFWLGVMCDTTSSVLNQCSLIIPDTETFTNPSSVARLDSDSVTTATFGTSRDHHSPERITQSVDIWGSYLLDAIEFGEGVW